MHSNVPCLQFAFYWLDPSAANSDPTSYNLADYPHRSASWRIPIAWQVLLCIPTFITIWMPESPRWLLLRGREEEARQVIASLDELPLDDPEVDTKVKEIKLSLDISSGHGVKELFKQGKEKNFHRALLGFINQMFQQISGINLITYYAATIYQQNIGLTPLVARIVGAANGTEYFLASFIAVWTIERFGRRKLMLFGAAGMCITMILLSILTADSVTKPDANNEATNKGAPVAAAVFLFVVSMLQALAGRQARSRGA